MVRRDISMFCDCGKPLSQTIETDGHPDIITFKCPHCEKEYVLKVSTEPTGD